MGSKDQIPCSVSWGGNARGGPHVVTKRGLLLGTAQPLPCSFWVAREVHLQYGLQRQRAWGWA